MTKRLNTKDTGVTYKFTENVYDFAQNAGILNAIVTSHNNQMEISTIEFDSRKMELMQKASYYNNV